MKIAIIDDLQSFLDDFQTKYENMEKDIIIDTFRSLEEALPVLEDKFYEYDFVILDGKGYRYKDETGDGDELFATDAREELEKLISKKKQDLPYCYYTAYSDDKVLESLGNKCYSGTSEKIQIFKKKLGVEEDEKLFAFITSKIAQKGETTIKQKYPDIFEIFSLGYLDKLVERDLINTLLLLKNLTDDNSKQLSRNIRPILESICSRLTALDRKFTSINIRRGNEQSLRGALKFLAGSPTYNNNTGRIEETTEIFLPKHLYTIILAIQDSSSTSVMHTYDSPITKYTAKAYLFGLMDFMLWFKELCKNHQN
jgi:hypothetical protein